jgi:hypothetical protein
MPTYNRQESIRKRVTLTKSKNLLLHTVISVKAIKYLKAGKISRTAFKANGGSLWRQRLTITHVTFRRKVTGISFWINSTNGLITPNSIA